MNTFKFKYIWKLRYSFVFLLYILISSQRKNSQQTAFTENYFFFIHLKFKQLRHVRRNSGILFDAGFLNSHNDIRFFTTKSFKKLKAQMRESTDPG